MHILGTYTFMARVVVIFVFVFLQDAWLDSIDANKDYAANTFAVPKNDDDVADLSSDDLGKINRRIADSLEPGETVRLISLFSVIAVLCEIRIECLFLIFCIVLQCGKCSIYFLGETMQMASKYAVMNILPFERVFHVITTSN